MAIVFASLTVASVSLALAFRDRAPLVRARRTTAMAEAEWGAWMAAAQGGNAAAYRRLLDEVSVWLRRYYQHRLPPGMTDDAVQDALIAIHEKRHTYDPDRPFGPWLGAIARY